MLQLKDISKSYTTVGFTQKALDGVSISFRESEFVAILGPSGSGKTTMLNIIGGLDHYDEGDLNIDGISTKKYEDTDWDTYRNNRIGFVFQSYNLIPHQTVLANVELALTLSGVSKEERQKRAVKTLEDLGLEDHINKLPSQLSGGQMQRVAIARALINNPEILLADEPTGALDTDTGIQVMELLKRIAKERLVILVTHNSELAEQYANRIVHLKDGKVQSDSMPYIPEPEINKTKSELRKTGMSFFTAVSLSFSNLRTKLARTFVTSLAGSIGIIGIAAILALATGINNYIRDVERDTMNIYPLTIQEAGFDLTSMFSDPSERIRDRDNLPPNTVHVINIIDTMFSYQNRNDLGALKNYMDENEEELKQIVQKVEYKYGITPQIYLPDTSREVQQVNPDTILSSYGLGADSGMASLASSYGFTPMGSFSEISGDMDLIEEQFDVLVGHWPQNFDEVILVLSPHGGIPDYLLYAMGLRDRTRLATIIESVMESTEAKIQKNEDESSSISFDDLMDVKFKVISPADKFTYDSGYNIWVDRSTDKNFMSGLINNGVDLRIVGIVKSKPDVTVTTLGMGINYTPELVKYLMEEAANRKVVQDQLEKPNINVLTGNTFSQEVDQAKNRRFQFTDLIKIDENAMADALNFDESALDMDSLAFNKLDLKGLNLSNINLSGMNFSDIDLSTMGFSNTDMPDIDLSKMDFGDLDFTKLELPNFDSFKMDFSEFDFSKIDFSDTDFSKIEPPDFDIAALTSALADVIRVPAADIDILIRELMQEFISEQVANEVTDHHAMGSNLNSFLSRPDVLERIQNLQEEIPEPEGIKDQMKVVLQQYIGDVMHTYTKQYAEVFKSFLQSSKEAFNAQIIGSLQEQMKENIENYMSSVSNSIQSQLMEQMQSKFMEQLQSQVMISVQNQIMSGFQNQLMTQLENQLASQLQNQFMPLIQNQIENAMKDSMGNFPEKLQNAMSIDEEAFAKAFKLTMDEDEILEIMNALMNPKISSYEKNMQMLGYADLDIPSQIDIYPVDFQSKAEVVNFINDYNEKMDGSGESEKVVRYTDIVGAMMTSVTNIVNMISNVLIAFVAISLIVSSIMIGVITYISVLERKKEIGILRAVGASKKDIRRVFNAETLIVGFVAGVIGIVVTYLLTIPANIIVYNRFNVERIAQLPVQASLILIGVSMVLAFIAGLIPSSAAANKDPVEALRSE